MLEKKRIPWNKNTKDICKAWNKKDLPQENICDEYFNGESIYKLAKRYGCRSVTPICRILKLNNVKMRKGGAFGFEPSNKMKLPEEDICDLYNKGYSSSYIADKFNCSKTPIRRILKKVIRPAGKTFSLRYKLGYIKSWNINKKGCYKPETIKKMSESQKRRTEGRRKGIKLSKESILKRTETRKKHGPYEIKEKTRLLLSKNNARYWKNKSRDKDTIAKIKMKRALQNPVYTSSIEVKIRGFLKQLGITFFTHQYMKEITHNYQCDIFIPSMKLVIECDGDYWHKYPVGNEIDHIRTKELLEKGFKVLRLWEFEINKMNLNDFKNKLMSGELNKNGNN